MRARMPLAAVLSALLLAALAVAARQAAADQLLPNGDFSQGKDGWTRSPPNHGVEFDTGCAGYGAEPAARLHLDADSVIGWLTSEAIPIEAGATYEASGYAHFIEGSDPSSQLKLVLAFFRAADGTDPLPRVFWSGRLTYDVTLYTAVTTGSVTAPDQAHSARLQVEFWASGPTTACLDDLRIDGPRPLPTVPVPSSTPTSRPSATVGPTATATAVPMPSGSVLNGGFEEGAEDIPAVWRKFGGVLFRSASVRRSGSFAGAFSSSTTSTKWVYQPLSVHPGHSYTFHGFVLKNDPPDSLVLLRISWYSSADASGSSLASSDSPMTLSGTDPSFRHLSTGSVTAPQEARSARARILIVPASAAPETIHLDDFVFEETDPPTPTPEPTETPTSSPAQTATPSPQPVEATPSAASMPRGRLLNGGFEEGVRDMPAAWRKFGGVLSRSTSLARSGSFAGVFTSATTSTKWVFQPLSVESGRSYSLHGFVLKNGLPDSLVFLRISWYSSPDASGSSFASSDSAQTLPGGDSSFRYLSTGSVAAPQEARSARARIVFVPASAIPETIYLDDFVFEETAPPTPTSTSETQETIPLSEARAAAPADELKPPPMPSDRSGPASDGGVRTAVQIAQAPAPQGDRPPTSEDSPYAVKISEVLADAGRGRDDAAYEWVELHNAGSEGVELGGWILGDNVADDTLPPVTLSAGGYAVVAASRDFRRQYPAFDGNLVVLADGRLGNGLANEGDRLLLLDEEGRPVDALSYGSDREFFEPPAPAVPPGHSLERFPQGRDTDTATDFRDNAHPSPGTGPAPVLPPTATATSRLSEVQGQALSSTGSDSGPSWPLLLLAAGLIFVGGTGAGGAGVLLWLVRGRHR